MDPEESKLRIEQLEEQLKKFADLKTIVELVQNKPNDDNTSSQNIPLPKPLNITDGDLKENFTFFQRSWERYLVASNLQDKDENKKIAILLTAVGDDVFKRFDSLPLSEDDKSTEKKLLTALGKCFTPEVNKRYERAMFTYASQEPDESYDTYFVRLRGLIQNCQYGELLEDLLLDKIICSIKDHSLRARLWENRKIDLQTAIDTCRSKEASDKQLKEIDVHSSSNSSGTILADVNKLKYSSRKSRSRSPKRNAKTDVQCNYCGYKHKSDGNCPAKNATCRKCNKAGHFAKVCMSRRSEHVKKFQERADPNEHNSEEYVFTVNESTKRGMFADIQLCIDDEKNRFEMMKCQLDTGASCNVVGLDWLCDILRNNNPDMSPTTVNLKVFGGNIMEPIGEITLKVKHKNVEYSLLFQIVDFDHGPLLSSKTCERMQLIKVCNLIGDMSTNTEANRIIMKFADVFEGLGQLKGEVSLETDENIKPTMQPPRRVPVAMKEILEKTLDEMVDLGVIVKEPMYTEWTSNILLVKRNEKLRICLDPIELNKALLDAKYQLPTIEEVLPELHNAKVFSTVDAKHGFWQVSLDKKSSMMTSFWTPFGRYRFLRMPFGISPAMEIYQKKQNEVLQGLKGISVMADDILIYGCGDSYEEAVKDHNKNLENLLTRLRKVNLKLNPDKVKLCLPEVKYYGHILTSNGVKPDTSKVSAITNMEKPKDKKGVLRFLGMVTYLNKFLPNLSTVAEPLRKLTHDNTDFIWTSVHDKVFEDLKQLVANATMLNYFNANKPVVIQTDASSTGLGCSLRQDSPVAYGSKTLTSTQRNYAQIEKEMLAVVFACQRFDQYICGKKDVIVETDHSPLVNIFKKPLLAAPKRLQSMILSLQRYNIKLKYTRGTEMYIADTLSRAPESTSNAEKMFDIYKLEDIFNKIDETNVVGEIRIRDVMKDKIQQETKVDPMMQKLKNVILNGWPENIREVEDSLKCYWNYRELLTTQDNFVFKGDRFIIPASLRKDILTRLHASHGGIENTTKLAKETVFWPGIYDQIKNKVQSCDVCSKFAPNQKREPMMTHTIPNMPFERVSLDVFEVEIANKVRKFLLTVDHYSDFFEMDELSDMTAKTTINMCKRNFARYGIPLEVISDGGSNFDCLEFRNFERDWEFNFKTSSPYHQQGNGKTEAAVGIAKALIKKCVENGEDFHKGLLIWRNTPNKIGTSPSQRMFNRWLRCNIPVSENKSKQEIPQNVPQKIKNQRDYSKQYYDRGTKPLSKHNVGDPVYIKVHPKKSTWTEGYIEAQSEPRSFIVSANGREYRRNNIHIKPAIEEIDPNQPNQDTESETDESGQSGHTSSTTTPVRSTTPHTSELRPKRAIRIPRRFEDYQMN